MAVDSTATKETEEKLEAPEDEVLEAQASAGESEDEDDEEDDIDEELLDLAATFGVNPEDFDSSAELEKEIYRVAGQQSQAGETGGDGKAAVAVPEELALEAYDLQLSDENIDGALLAELRKFSKVQTERFTKALNDLRAKHRDEIGALAKQVQRLTGVTDTHVTQNDFRLIDKWRRKNGEAQTYYGEEDYDGVEHDSRSARRMRSLRSKAYRLANTYHQQNKRPPSINKLLDMAFAATSRKGKGKDKPLKSKIPTNAARATGSGSGTTKPEGKKKLDERDLLEEKGKKVEEWQRQHGINV